MSSRRRLHRGERRYSATASAALAVAILLVANLVVLTWGQTSHASRRASSASAAAGRRLPAAGRVQILSVRSADAAGGLRKVWVYRPGVPDSASLPVAYYLHGLPGTYRDLADLGVAGLLDRLITTGALPPFVLVVPDGNSTGAADPEWADSVDGKVQLESFVTGPLITAVEGANRRDRAHRAILGFSMGGYGAMNLALRHPDLYGAVAAIAGYFGTDDESGIFAGRTLTLRANQPNAELAAAGQLRIMLADGSGDRLAVTAGQTQRFAALLQARGLHPAVDIGPGGHTPAYLASELPRAFAFLAGVGPFGEQCPPCGSWTTGWATRS